MGRRFLVTGTGAAVGKTTIGCALAFAFRARGARVGVMKPAETGCPQLADGSLDPIDSRALAQASGCMLALEVIAPFRYRAAIEPAAAAELEGVAPPDTKKLKEYFQLVEAACDCVIVEGPGGLAAPINWNLDSAGLAALLKLELIVIVGNRPGCLNEANLTLKYAQNSGLQVAGYILCDVGPANSAEAQAVETSLARITQERFLGRMRHREPLAKSIVDKLL